MSRSRLRTCQREGCGTNYAAWGRVTALSAGCAHSGANTRSGRGEGVIREWFLRGAQIGLTAFVTVAVFMVCCAAVLGVLTLILRLIQGGDGE